MVIGESIFREEEKKKSRCANKQMKALYMHWYGLCDREGTSCCSIRDHGHYSTVSWGMGNFERPCSSLGFMQVLVPCKRFQTTCEHYFSKTTRAVDKLSSKSLPSREAVIAELYDKIRQHLPTTISPEVGNMRNSLL